MSPEPSSTPIDVRHRERGCLNAALAGTIALTVLSGALFVARQWPDVGLIWLSDAWPTCLPIIQGLGFCALLWRYGRPVTLRVGAELILLNCWLIAVAVLFQQGEYGQLAWTGAGVALRLLMLGSWSIACLGLPYVLFRSSRSRRPPRLTLRFARIWFSSVVFLISAEPLMALLERGIAKVDGEKTALSFPARLADPRPNELQIVSLGESTMHGMPYEPKFGIPQVVAWRLQQMYPDRKVISLNLAVNGQNLRLAIDCLGKLHYRPHLLLLYSGHNEFFHDLPELSGIDESFIGSTDGLLRWSPTFRVFDTLLRKHSVLGSLKAASERKLVDQPIASPEIMERRAMRFRKQLEQLAAFGQRERIPMLWYVPAASESGFEPNRSVVKRGTSATEIAELYRCSQDGADRQRAEDWAGAAESYRDSLSRHPEFAEFHFRLAECLLKMDLVDEAREHYRQALDLDGYPARMIAPFRNATSEVAAAFSIPVVFAAEALRPHTPHGILDRSLIHDYVHPTLEGYYILGLAGVDRIASSRLLEPELGPPVAAAPVQFADAIEAMQIRRTDVAEGLRRIVNVLRWLARLRFDGTQRSAQADSYKRLAERLDAGEIEPGDEGTEALR